MSWTNLPANQATDWSQVDFLRQFALAINERLPWLSNGPAALSINNGQEAITFLQSCQSRLEAVVGAFVSPTVSASIAGSDTTIYSQLLDYPIQEWRTDAGLPADGFTRKYPREIESLVEGGSAGQRARSTSDGKIYEHNGAGWILSLDQSAAPDTLIGYGNMGLGDYIGPWIFNELQAGIRQLSHTARQGRPRGDRYSGSASGPDPGELPGDAQDDYSFKGTSSSLVVFREIGFGVTRYFAGQQGFDWDGTVFFDAAAPTADVDFRVYAYGTDTVAFPEGTNTYDDLGLGISLNAFSEVGSGNTTLPSPASVDSGLSLSSSTLPPWPSPDGWRGFFATNRWIVAMEPVFVYT
ncbi:MAG: hypothetical protein AAGI54_00675 [Planctomycetota bacterium]